MKFGRSFFSLYFLIIATFIIFSWLLDQVWNSYLEQDVESYTGYKTMLAAVGDYVQKHPEDEWEKVIKKTGERYGLPLAIIPLSEIKESEYENHNKIDSGDTHIYYTNDMVTLHYLLKGSGKVLSLGPAKMPTRPKVKAIYRVIILTTFGIIIFIWLWPVSRDLDELKQVTSKFGQGDFNVKAANAKSSMMGSTLSSFNMMAERIKRLIDAHKELTSAVSHELRTPLARTKFALQMLSSVKDDGKREKYHQQITRDVCELEELINEMLIYASFDSDRPDLDFKNNSIYELVATQVASHQDFSDSIELIDNSQGLFVECDNHFIDRALNNFISNAIKYGAGKVRVTISTQNGLVQQNVLKSSQQSSQIGSQISNTQNTYCVICVEDNGDGVSDEFKKVIFDAFSRGDQSRNRETGGFGLGLAIVARIMEWHYGEASIADSDLGGAAFTLTLPIKHV